MLLVMWHRQKLTVSFVLIVLALSSCSGYDMTELIDAPVHITKDWSEFSLARPLRCDRTDQEILIKVATPHQLDAKSWGVVLPDGSVATPEVQVRDTSGRQYNLDQRSFWGDAMCFQGRTLPNQQDFAKVMVRSDVPIDVSKIAWNCYNFEDHKR